MSASTRNILAVVTATSLLASCTAPRPDKGHAPPAEPPPPVATPPAADDPRTGVANSPTSTAQAWFAAYHHADWREEPTAWIDDVRPYVTPALDKRNTALRDGHTGVDWQQFVRRQCVTTATDIDAVIPPEAPGTRTTVNVQVAGTLTTSCALGQPETPRRLVAATIVTTRSHVKWQVDQLLY